MLQQTLGSGSQTNINGLDRQYSSRTTTQHGVAGRNKYKQTETHTEKGANLRCDADDSPACFLLIECSIKVQHIYGRSIAKGKKPDIRVSGSSDRKVLDTGMPKVGMQPVRRRQLIDATITTIHQYGFADATISRIAGAAGMSSGIISHYFGGKNALLEATMLFLMQELRADFLARVAQCKTPMQRLEAIVNTNFNEEQFTPQVTVAWLSFWAQVPFSDALRRLNTVYFRRLASNLRHELRALTSDEKADEIAGVIAALIDGIWVRSGLSPGQANVEAARKMVLDTLRLRLNAASAP
jgi:TetR/AcrR family transcriptional repressor of bet genes|tara:strand:- start:63276 stop:64166 length:891 start_codon:yes stop_codon:yes gene_type:complete